MKKYSIFPNLSTIASYNTMSQTIELSDINRSDLEQFISNPITLDTVEKFCTLSHEINHYFDNISTLRGVNMLASLFNAYNSIHRDTQTEDNMWRVVNYNRHIRGMKFEDYYKVVEKEVIDPDYRSWSFMQTIGSRYNYEGIPNVNKPIIFNRFYYKNEYVARMPISIESLWESNSIAIELELKSKLINILIDPVEKLIEENRFIKDVKEWVYDTEMLIYSNIAHLVAKDLIITGNIMETFIFTKKLSSLCLNLPDKYYSKIRIPNFIKMNIHHKHIEAFINNRDIAFMYMCLLHNIKETIFLEEMSGTSEIDDLILYSSSLPDAVTIQNEVRREIENIGNKVVDGYYKKNFEEVLERGTNIFSQRGLFNKFDYSKLNIDDIQDLPIICADEVCNDDTPIIKWHSEVSVLEKRIMEFVNACGY